MSRFRATGVFLTLVALVASATFLSVRARAGTIHGAYVEGQVVIRLAPPSGASVHDIDRTYGTSVAAALPGDAQTFLLTVAPGATVASTLAAMEADPRLEGSEPNFIGSAPEVQNHEEWAWGGFDPAPYQQSWALAAIDVPTAFAVTRGRGALVAILDTGAQLDHPALAGAFVPGYDFVKETRLPLDQGIGPEVGHGTHVAGIVHLVAPDAAILPLRILGPDGRGTTFAMARAISYATAHGASVINLSISTESQSLLVHRAVRQATLAGAVVVAAAGNLASSAQVFPAADQCSIGVTSVGPTGVLSDFADFGGWIDFAAPGERISSTFPTGGYAMGSGTSMATAFVSGQAALIKSIAPSRNALDIGMLMANTATSLHAANPLFRGQLGAGRPDVARSVTAAAANTWMRSGASVISSSCVGF